MEAITRYRAFLVSMTLLMATPLIALAEEDQQEEREFPKSGILSGGYIGGFEGAELDGPVGFEDQDIFTGQKAPITGSVSRTDSNYWTMRVFNNEEEDTYLVNLEVVQIDKRNNRLHSDNFSYTLKPQENASRQIRSRSNTVNMLLKLTSWRKLGGKKKVQQEENSGAETKATEQENRS